LGFSGPVLGPQIKFGFGITLLGLNCRPVYQLYNGTWWKRGNCASKSSGNVFSLFSKQGETCTGDKDTFLRYTHTCTAERMVVVSEHRSGNLVITNLISASQRF